MVALSEGNAAVAEALKKSEADAIKAAEEAAKKKPDKDSDSDYGSEGTPMKLSALSGSDDDNSDGSSPLKVIGSDEEDN